MTMIEAARMGDKVAHTNALLGFLGGMVLGAAMAVGLALLAGATIATGGGALILAGALLAGAGGGALAGMNLGATFKKGTGLPILTGAARTFIGQDRRPAARAVADQVSCHTPQLIAEGSLTVFVERMPAARRTDMTACGGKIDEGWPTVFIGKEAGRYLAVESEVPSWMVTAAKWSMIIGTGLGLAGGVLVAGVAVTALGFAGGWAGGKLGGHLGGELGEYLGGERGRIVGEYLGGELGGLVGGHLGGKLGQRVAPAEIAAARNALKPFPELAARIAKAPGESPTHIAARQNVARAHYETTRPIRAGQSPEEYRADVNSHMAGIDFRKPVQVRTLEQDTIVYTYKEPPVGGVSPNPGSYVAYEKQSPSALGIGEQVRTPGGIVDKHLYEGRLRAGTQVLESTSSPKLDDYSIRADGSSPARVADSAGGGRQVNVNDRNAWMVDPRTGQKLNPTGETTAGYRDPSVSQDVARRPLDYSRDVPIAGDSGAQVINRGGAVGTTTGNEPDSGGDP